MTVTADALVLGWPVVAMFLAVDLIALAVWGWFRHRSAALQRALTIDDHLETLRALQAIRDVLFDLFTVHEQIEKTLTEIRDQETEK